MKKKILAAILTATLLIAGCESVNVSTEQNEKLIMVERGSGYGICADKVMYLFIKNAGGITVMLNADGTPKIWNREE